MLVALPVRQGLPAFREAPEGVCTVRENVNRTIGEIRVRVHDIPKALEGSADGEKLPNVVRALTQGHADVILFDSMCRFSLGLQTLR